MMNNWCFAIDEVNKKITRGRHDGMHYTSCLVVMLRTKNTVVYIHMVIPVYMAWLQLCFAEFKQMSISIIFLGVESLALGHLHDCKVVADAVS